MSLHPRLQALLTEHNLELDDVRWYLSQQLATELLHFQERPLELTAEIWSGRLADRLYELEDRFLAELGQKMTLGHSDEGQIRDQLGAIRVARRRRPRTMLGGETPHGPRQ